MSRQADNNSSATSAGYWTFSQPLEHDLRVAGEPKVTLTADINAPHGNAVVILYDYTPGGSAREMNRSAVRFDGDGTKTITLHPRDHVVREGHRLAVHVTSGHPEFLPYQTNQSISISQASIDIPFLTWERVINLTGTKASSSSRTVTPTFSASDALTWPLPGPMTPYPTDDDNATRESVKPTVSTPAG